MILEGGCYCGGLRYSAAGEPLLRAQCYCRACQHVSGGGPNLFILVPDAGFRWTRGRPQRFTRTDLDAAVSREFCAICGTHIVNRRPGLDPVILKIGTLDDPGHFGGAQMAIFTAQKQTFHCIPHELPAYEGLPPG